MAYHTGKVFAKDLFTTILGKITQAQPGESSAWWVKESSLDSDGVYTSTGSTNNERLVLVFREGTIGKNFVVGMARDYTPGVINTAGAFDTLQVTDLSYFSTVQDQYTEVSYDVSVTRDRVIIHVQGDKLITQWQNTIAYLGMPVRYDINDKKCVLKALSEGDPRSASATLMQDSVGNTMQAYNWYYVASPANPSWGNTYFLETLHFGLGNEGLRGELEGLYGTFDAQLVDGDEIDVAGVKFKVIIRRAVGSNAFPRTALLMRKS